MKSLHFRWVALPLGFGASIFACDYGPKEPPGTSTFPAGIPGHTFGVVVDDGERVPGARVLVGQSASFVDMVDGGVQEAIRTTNSVGFFEFRGFGRNPVDGAYDVTVRSDDARPQDVGHFVGLERFFGTYALFSDPPRRGWSSRLEVTLESRPEGATVVAFVSGGVIQAATPLPNGLELAWSGSYEATMDVHVLAYAEDPATKLPARYLGYARTPVTFRHGSVTPLRAALAPVESLGPWSICRRTTPPRAWPSRAQAGRAPRFREIRSGLTIANPVGTTRFPRRRSRALA